MRIWKSFLILIAALSVGAGVAFGQGASPRSGTVVVPASNVELPSDVGVRAHTNYLIFHPAGGKLVLSSPSGETPGSMACIYGLVAGPSGCPISTATAIPNGGSGIIAIVDAYHYPTASNDFDVFSNYFGLPTGNNCNGGQPCFTQVSTATGHLKTNSGWALEAALDIEWAHAMAPNAQIVLVEAASNSNADLFDAVAVATNIVATCNGACTSGGKGEVSMSWGGSESSTESTYDTYFSAANGGVVYTAASGDSGGVVIYPSASPYVLSAGGTTVQRDKTGAFTGEIGWSDGGGGDSAYEPAPGYQSAVPSVEALVGNFRGTPDFSYNADPGSGVSVYDSTSYQGLTGWFTIGGTSVSSPALAGVINLAAGSGGGSFAADSYSELSRIYSAYNSGSYSSDFTDILNGSTSGCSGGGGGGNPHHKSSSSSCYNAGPNWDFMTGVGTNLGTSGK